MNKNKLTEVLSLVKPALTSKEVIEQSTCFVFKDNKVYTYNEEIAISMPIDIEIEGAVQAKELFQLLTKVKDDEIDFDQKDDTEINIKGKKFKSGIRLETEIKLPIDSITVKGKWNKLPENFIEAVNFCKFSTSKDESLPVFTCVHIHKDTVLSTDKARITEYKLLEDCFPEPVLIPANSVDKLSKYNVNQYIIKEGWIHFRNSKNKFQFSCRTLSSQEEYPVKMVTNALETETSETITFPEKIKDILSTANIFVTSELDQNTFVTITIKKNRIFIKGEGDAGWYREQTKIDYKDKEPIEFMVNPNFLSEIISHVNKVYVDIDSNKILFIGDDFKHGIAMLKG